MFALSCIILRHYLHLNTAIKMVGKSPALFSERCTAIIAFVQQPPREEGFDSLIPFEILVSAAVIYQIRKPFCAVKTVRFVKEM